MTVADTADWTRPITVLLEGDLTADTPDWTIPVIVETGGGVTGPPSSDPTLPAGAIGQTVDRYRAGGSNTTWPLGDLYLTAIWLPGSAIVGHLSFITGPAGISGPSHWWFGLYDSSLSQLAVTADQLTAAWASATLKTLAVAQIAGGASATFSTTYTGLYYVGVMVAGSGGPTMLSTAQASAAIGGLAPVLNGTSDTGQTAPPTFPHAAAAITGPSAGLYAYVS